MAAVLGSSAAATVAGLRVFERVTEPLSMTRCCWAWRRALEGHADNAAPALFGGLTSVFRSSGGDPVALRWPWPDELRLVVATPAVGLATAKARAALPDMCRGRTRFSTCSACSSLVHALQSGDYDRLREAVRRSLASAGARGARAAARRGRWRLTIRTCWARSCRARGRRWRCSRGAIRARVEQLLDIDVRARRRARSTVRTLERASIAGRAAAAWRSVRRTGETV